MTYGKVRKVNRLVSWLLVGALAILAVGALCGLVWAIGRATGGDR